MNTASSADVQANYLKDCDNWAPPVSCYQIYLLINADFTICHLIAQTSSVQSPRVKVEELRTLDQPPRRCMATSAYKAKCSSEHSILQGEEVEQPISVAEFISCSLNTKHSP